MPRIRETSLLALHQLLGAALETWRPGSTSAVSAYVLRHGVVHLQHLGARARVRRQLRRAEMVGAAADAVGDTEVIRWLASAPDPERVRRWREACPASFPGDEARPWLAVARLLSAEAQPLLAAEVAGRLVAGLGEDSSPEAPLWAALEQRGRAFLAAGRRDEARSSAGEWLVRAVETAGEDSWLAARAWWQFAVLDRDVDDTSELLADVAVHGRRAGLPTAEQLRIEADRTLALAAEGETAAAVASARRLLAVRRRELGEFHPDTLEGQVLLGDALERKGAAAAAIRSWEAAMGGLRRLFGPDHPRELLLRQRCWQVLAARGRVRQAQAGFEDLARRWRSRRGAPATVALELATSRARCVGGLESPAAAVPLVRAALEEARGRVSVDEPAFQAARHLLADLVEDTGEIEASLALRVETAVLLGGEDVVAGFLAHDAWDRAGAAALHHGRARLALRAFRALNRALREDDAVDAQSVCRLGRAEVACGLWRAGRRTLRRGLVLARDDPHIGERERTAARQALRRALREPGQPVRRDPGK
jgi:hypothetical protein